MEEFKRSFQACGRLLKKHVVKERKQADLAKRKEYVNSFVPLIAVALGEILGLEKKAVKTTEKQLYSLLGEDSNKDD